MASFLLQLSKTVANHQSIACKAFFNNCLDQRIKDFEKADKRAIKLLRFGFIKKLNPRKRLLTKSRLFLRWKARADREAQNQCIKRFAVQARLNYAVAIYRLRWVAEKANKDKRRRHWGYRRAVGAFDERTKRIKREIYGARNQKQYALRVIKNQYLWLKKVDRLREVLERAFRQRAGLRESMLALRERAEAKEFLATRLEQIYEGKRRGALNKLKRHYIEYMLRNADLRGDALAKQTGEILRRRVKDNLETCLRSNKDVVHGLEKLRSLMENRKRAKLKEGFDEAGIRKDYTDELMRGKLTRLEIIAQSALGGNLQRIAHNNDISRIGHLENFLAILDKIAARRLQKAFLALKGGRAHDRELLHFAYYLDQLFNQKSNLGVLKAFLAIKERADDLNGDRRAACGLFGALQRSLFTPRAEDFEKIYDFADEQKRKNDALNKLAKILDRFQRRGDRKEGYDGVNDNLKRFKDRENGLQKLANLAKENELRGQRAALAAILLHYIHQIHPQAPIDLLKNLADRGKNKGLDKLSSISGLLKRQGTMNNLSFGNSMILLLLDALKRDHLAHAFNRIKTFYYLFRWKLNFVGMNRWKALKTRQQLREKLANTSNIIQGALRLKSLFTRSYKEQRADAFYQIQAAELSKLAALQKVKSLLILAKIEKMRTFSGLLEAFGRIKAYYRVLDERDGRFREKLGQVASSLLGTLNSNLLNKRRVRRKFIRRKEDFKFADPKNREVKTTGINNYLAGSAAVNRARDFRDEEQADVRIDLDNVNQNGEPLVARVYPVMVHQLGTGDLKDATVDSNWRLMRAAVEGETGGLAQAAHLGPNQGLGLETVKGAGDDLSLAEELGVVVPSKGALSQLVNRHGLNGDSGDDGGALGGVEGPDRRGHVYVNENESGRKRRGFVIGAGGLEDVASTPPLDIEGLAALAESGALDGQSLGGRQGLGGFMATMPAGIAREIRSKALADAIYNANESSPDLENQRLKGRAKPSMTVLTLPAEIIVLKTRVLGPKIRLSRLADVRPDGFSYSRKHPYGPNRNRQRGRRGKKGAEFASRNLQDSPENIKVNRPKYSAGAPIEKGSIYRSTIPDSSTRNNDHEILDYRKMIDEEKSKKKSKMLDNLYKKSPKPSEEYYYPQGGRNKRQETKQAQKVPKIFESKKSINKIIKEGKEGYMFQRSNEVLSSQRSPRTNTRNGQGKRRKKGGQKKGSRRGGGAKNGETASNRREYDMESGSLGSSNYSGSPLIERYSGYAFEGGRRMRPGDKQGNRIGSAQWKKGAQKGRNKGVSASRAGKGGGKKSKKGKKLGSKKASVGVVIEGGRPGELVIEGNAADFGDVVYKTSDGFDDQRRGSGGFGGTSGGVFGDYDEDRLGDGIGIGLEDAGEDFFDGRIQRISYEPGEQGYGSRGYQRHRK